jgi:hypothetical protein
MQGKATMDKFLHDENLKLLHKRLTETTDEKQRQVRHSSSPNEPKEPFIVPPLEHGKATMK